MRVRFRIPLLWVLLCAVSFACVLACLIAWFVLLSGICSNPRSPEPQTQHVILYNCHGMKVYISPVDDAMLHWLTPAGLLFMFISFGAGAMVAKAAAKTWQPLANRGHVRIVAVPPGEAPLWVREKWVGLELPLAQSSAGAMPWRAGGVLTGPRGFAATVGRLLRGKLPEQRGYVVNVLEAMAVLEAASPEAVQWWRTNAPHLMTPPRYFVFPEQACLMMDPPPAAAASLRPQRS